MEHLVKAIDGALNQHAEIEKHVARWELDLAASIANGIIETLSEKLFVSEMQKAQTAMLATELARDFVDDLPNFFSKQANGATLDRSAYAAALTPKLASAISARIAKAVSMNMRPLVKKQDEAYRKQQAMQPVNAPNAGPSMGIDLGAYAQEQSQRFALEDARKAAPVAPAPSQFIDPDLDTMNVMQSGEATLAQAYPSRAPAPAPSIARVKEALAQADTMLETRGGKYPAKPKKRR